MIKFKDFKFGDKVMAYGCKGIVIDIDFAWYQSGACISVIFKKIGKDQIVRFYRDGKEQKWHEKPSLEHTKF